VKKINITVVILFISLIITAFLFFINDIVISIRLDELRAKLLEKNQTESSMDHIGLIATYQINKNVFEKKISQEDADALEVKVMSLSKSEEKDSPAVIQAKYKIISQPALLMINFNRNIIGKAPLIYRQSADRYAADLDVAYYYERNFFFSRAISLYDKVLENRNMDSTLKAGILLHQGYCYALAGLNDKAIHNYSTIINKYGNENSAITAAILSRYLEGFKLAREKVLRSNADPILRSQDLVNLLAYGQALKILEEEERRANPGDIPRIKYFKARCFTGIGEPEKAAENYLDVIVSSPSSQYAKYSNRKLFLIGSRAGGENDIIKLSEQLNGRLEDPVLSEMIKNQKDDIKPADKVSNLEKLNISKLFLEKAEKFAEGKEKSAALSKYYIILTSDGNTFKGTLIEQDDKEIALQTSIGRINVKRDKITSITIK
jgi:tetratricopeptide (TPR) repeat protein